MRTIDNTKEYQQFVETVARNNIERDGSNPHHVANCCIINIEVIDESTATLSYNGLPYTKERVPPTEILTFNIGSVENPFELSADYRNAAVDLLADDIADAQKRIQEEN